MPGCKGCTSSFQETWNISERLDGALLCCLLKAGAIDKRPVVICRHKMHSSILAVPLFVSHIHWNLAISADSRFFKGALLFFCLTGWLKFNLLIYSAQSCLRHPLEREDTGDTNTHTHKKILQTIPISGEESRAEKNILPNAGEGLHRWVFFHSLNSHLTDQQSHLPLWTVADSDIGKWWWLWQ